MSDAPNDKGYQYIREDKLKRAERIANEIDRRVGVKGKIILDVGCHRGEISEALCAKGAEVVGVDIEPHDNWPIVRSKSGITLLEADISKPISGLSESSFDRIVSISVWEHIHHPWSALRQCQKYLKPDGKFYLFSMLYRSAGASHLIHRLPERWPHLLYTPDVLKQKLNTPKLGPSFWCNKLTYQQYLFYFRKLGFYITFESFNRDMFDSETFNNNKDVLDLYPMWDLQTDFFKVVLEFDQSSPKAQIIDPVYRVQRSS